MGDSVPDSKTATPITSRAAPKYLKVILGCLLGSIGLIFIIAVVIGVSSEPREVTMQQATTVEATKPKPPTSKPIDIITANHLVNEYVQNEVAADAKYKGRTIIVSGMVTGIGLDLFDDAYVIIGGTDAIDGIQCSFPDSEKGSVSKLVKGQIIDVRGVVTGKLGNLFLDKCKIQLE